MREDAVIDFPDRTPAARAKTERSPEAPSSPESDAVIRALVMQGIFEMGERTWW